MTINKTVKAYVTEALAIAKDDTHGYSQIKRSGPDYDCSSFVIHCVDAAGLDVSGAGATYTGNMLRAFKRRGFVNVVGDVNLDTGKGLQRGDILLHRRKHTEIYLGSKKMVGAHCDELGGTDGAQTGDQTGYEISKRAYYNYPWQCVLRYKNSNTASDENNTLSNKEIALQVIDGLWGNGARRRIRLKRAGYNYKTIQALVNKLLSK